MDLQQVLERVGNMWAGLPSALQGSIIVLTLAIILVLLMARRPAMPKVDIPDEIDLNLNGLTIPDELTITHEGIPEFPDHITVTIEHKGLDQPEKEPLEKRTIGLDDMKKMHAVIGVHHGHLKAIIDNDDADEAQQYLDGIEDLRRQCSQFLDQFEA